jgi:hypothetical protein
MSGSESKVRGWWWARGELNHSTPASYLGLYAIAQVSAVVLGSRRPFDAVPRQTVMPRGITDDHDRVAGPPPVDPANMIFTMCVRMAPSISPE